MIRKVSLVAAAVALGTERGVPPGGQNKVVLVVGAGGARASGGHGESRRRHERTPHRRVLEASARGRVGLRARETFPSPQERSLTMTSRNFGPTIFSL
ncbi:MAG: hypothetical protein LC795_07535 [Acidobacteria bacterium]|nr:hypothetical protein [Acidobacteriota bacterium]